MTKTPVQLEDETLNLMTAAYLLDNAGKRILDEHAAAILRWTLLKMPRELTAELKNFYRELKRTSSMVQWINEESKTECLEILKKISL